MLKDTLHFLIELQVNNDRNWFKANEKKFRLAQSSFESFIHSLIPELRAMDSSIDVTHAKECTFRIYRDTRFSGNKQPYKNNMGAFIARGGRKSPFAGYYVHFEPDQSFVGGGIYAPEPKYLQAIRENIYKDPEPLKKIIYDPDFVSTFGEMGMDKLKTAPKGFSRDFPDIELINNRHFVVSRMVDNEFWVENDPLSGVMEWFSRQYSFNQYLNQIIEKTKS